MVKILQSLKKNFNKYMTDLRPDRLMTYQSDRRLVVSGRPGIGAVSETSRFLIFFGLLDNGYSPEAFRIHVLRSTQLVPLERARPNHYT
jgi:hypothetical protein